MLTKYILTINGSAYELQQDDLRNWSDIKCSYKRSSYDGVVRSFTSQFEFVNRAYELLMRAYLADRFNASATVSVLTLSESWGFVKQFEAPLDFSTISWENETIKINSVDNSLAAMIKSKKSTTYEYKVGTDIKTDKSLLYDRLYMTESAMYELTQGESIDNSADIVVTFEKDKHPFVGLINSEVVVNQTVYFIDDQDTGTDTYVLEIVKACTVTLASSFKWREDKGTGSAALYVTRIPADGSTKVSQHIGTIGKDAYLTDRGTYTSASALWSAYKTPSKGDWALVNGIVWRTEEYMDDGTAAYRWYSTGKGVDAAFVQASTSKVTIDCVKGDKIAITHSVGADCDVRVCESKMTFSWNAKGDNVSIPAFTPEQVAGALLRKMADGKLNVPVTISSHDARLAKTLVLAAESARGLAQAKLYASFNQFCDWMSAVFGYVYTIGETKSSRFTAKRTFNGFVGHEYTSAGHYGGDVTPSMITYNTATKRFVVIVGDKTYTYWDGWLDYMQNGTSEIPRTDTLFLTTDTIPTCVAFENDASMHYRDPEEIPGLPSQAVTFLHRSELMGEDADVKTFDGVRDVKFSIDSASIYSSVEIGYEKKEYDNTNGRNEFNLNITYSTGCSVSDKKLSLISKFRADCYGLEFAVQKRGKDTTDTTSDKDVFFVNYKDSDGQMIPDRDTTVSGAPSDMFNAKYNPMECVKANAGYIGLQADPLTLKFASGTGNTAAVIGGTAINSDITLDTPIATTGVVEFSTDEVDDPADVNELIEFAHNGTTYRGWLKEVDIKYAKAEAAKYKVIVKEIEL